MYCKRIYFYETYFLIFHCRCTNLKENKNKVVELRYKTKSICGPVVQSLNIKTPNFHHYLQEMFNSEKHSIYLSPPFHTNLNNEIRRFGEIFRITTTRLPLHASLIQLTPPSFPSSLLEFSSPPYPQLSFSFFTAYIRIAWI